MAGGIIESWQSNLDVILHRDYGLPNLEKEDIKDYLFIASSYSGNTEETISSFEEARSQGLPLVVVAAGGKLLDLAKEQGAPYIQMPRLGNHPRFAIGHSIMATLAAMGKDSVINEIREWAASFDPGEYELVGKELAEKLQNKIPVIYSSGNNAGLARYWKISFNETAKVPAFYNVWPELNHNEMAGFGFARHTLANTRHTLANDEQFSFIFLIDSADLSKIQKRVTATKKLFEERGYYVSEVVLKGANHWQKAFSNIATAMWTSLYLAEFSGVDPEDISVI